MPPQLPVCLLVISACCPKDSDDIHLILREKCRYSAVAIEKLGNNGFHIRCVRVGIYCKKGFNNRCVVVSYCLRSPSIWL